MSFRRVLNTVSQTANTVSTGLRTTQRLASDIQSGNIGRTLRTTRSLLGLINGTSNGEMTQANFPSAGDWRVRLSMPSHPAGIEMCTSTVGVSISMDDEDRG